MYKCFDQVQARYKSTGLCYLLCLDNITWQHLFSLNDWLNSGRLFQIIHSNQLLFTAYILPFTDQLPLIDLFCFAVV
jgi:hypothetical protein